MKTDMRKKPGPPVQVSQKTKVGKDQVAFGQKRSEASKKGWDTRRQKQAGSDAK